MLYFIFIWTILLMVCCTIGTGLLHFLQATAFQRTGDRFIAAVWLGVIVLSVLYLLISLILPLSSLVGIAVATGCCGLALLNRSVRSELAALRATISLSVGLLYLIGAILIAVLSTRPVTWLDTGLYHYPLIHWLNQVGTVPGVALLFANFGFTSSWFAFAAPLNPAFLDARVSATTGGFVLLLALLQTGIVGGYILRRRAQFSDWFLGLSSAVLLLCLVGSSHLREISISPSPDIPVAILTGVVAWTILVVTNAVPASTQLAVPRDRIDSSLIPLILAVGTVTIKLVALPLLVVGSAFYLVRNRNSWRRLIDGLTAFTLFFMPFIIVQVFTSGCPLFPSSFLCLNTAWAVPVETKEWVTRLTHDWTNWYTPSTATSISLPVALLRWITDNRGNQIMALIGIGSIVAIGLLFQVLRKSSVQGYFWIIALQIVGMAFYLKTSPLLRFALPCLILIPVLLGATYCDSKFGRASATDQSTSPIGFKNRNPILFGLLGVAAASSIGVASARLLLPSPLQSAPIAQKQVNDITYLAPQNQDVCWGADLPCAFEVPTDIYLRDPGRGFAEGFVRAR